MHYRNLLEQHVLPWFGNVTQVREADARAFMQAKKGQGLSENTVFVMIRLLRRILEYGASQGLTTAPGWDALMTTPQKKNEPSILTPAEEKQLCDYLVENPSGKHLCLFLMLTTGMTIGETLLLKWQDVSIGKGEIRVLTERGPVTDRKRRVRRLKIGERQKLYLRRMAASTKEAYLATGTSRPMGRASLEDRFRRIVKEQVLPPITPTGLRHTFAVRCIEAGMDYETLSARLDEIYAVEGWEAVPALQSLCERVLEVAPPEPKRTGPKGKSTLQGQVRRAMEALERLAAKKDAQGTISANEQ